MNTALAIGCAFLAGTTGWLVNVHHYDWAVFCAMIWAQLMMAYRIDHDR